jgi:hypothetical protein
MRAVVQINGRRAAATAWLLLAIAACTGAILRGSQDQFRDQPRAQSRDRSQAQATGIATTGAVAWTGTGAIDLLPFIVGDDAHWPRHGSHEMDRRWDGHDLWWIKFGHPDHWEHWVLDGDAFILREDRSQSGAGDYSFHPGRWFPRHMAIGQTIDARDNVIQEYEPDTCAVQPGTRVFPYRLRFLQAWTRLDLGGDIGVLDGHGAPVAVLLEYDPGGDRDTRETGLYALGWGSVRWQAISQVDGALLHETTFNLLGGTPHLTPTRGCYRALAPSTPPSITIRDDYGPKQGRAPLTWHATAVITGDVTRIVWRWRKQGATGWTKKEDGVYTTVTLDEPGTYEIGVDGYGPGGSDGTATQRLIVVQH